MEEELRKYTELLLRYNSNYNEKVAVSKFKKGKYTFDNNKESLTLVCLIKYKDIDNIVALVQYNDRPNYKMHACVQLMHPIYLDDQYNLHVSDIVPLKQCFYNLDKEENFKQYNWNVERFNQGKYSIEKVYYKDTTKVFVDNNIFRVVG